MIKEVLTRALAMIVSVFIFAFPGPEHSVATSVLFLIVGFRSGIDVPVAVANVAVVLVGNVLGGGLLIGLYRADANGDRTFLRRRSGTAPVAGEDAQGRAMRATATAAAAVSSRARRDGHPEWAHVDGEGVRWLTTQVPGARSRPGAAIPAS